MGEMRDSDWSRENLLRSDWLVPKGASITTDRWFTTPVYSRREGRFVNSPFPNQKHLAQKSKYIYDK